MHPQSGSAGLKFKARNIRRIIAGIRKGMKTLGLVEGRDYVIEQRYANGNGSLLPDSHD